MISRRLRAGSKLIVEKRAADGRSIFNVIVAATCLALTDRSRLRLSFCDRILKFPHVQKRS